MAAPVLQVVRHGLTEPYARVYHYAFRVDAGTQSYDLSVDGEWVRRGVPFATKVDTLQRLVFRTGPWRGDVASAILDDAPATRGLDREDRAGAGQPASASVSSRARSPV